MIKPPPEIRKIADKTAEYVALKGREIEAKIKNREAGNMKFSFLQSDDPYYEYYQHMLQKYGQESSAQSQNDQAQKADQQIQEKPYESLQPDSGAQETVDHHQQSKSGSKKTSKKRKRKVIPTQPPQLIFLPQQEVISALDRDVMLLTAKYFTVKGQQFLIDLQSSHANDPQFGFLNPSHSLHAIYNSYVQQYSQIKEHPQMARDQLLQQSKDMFSVLKRCKQRVIWNRYAAKKAKLEEEQKERNKIQFMAIDWHDFAVVQTIQYTDQDVFLQLPAPLSLKQLQSLPLAQRQALFPVQVLNKQQSVQLTSTATNSISAGVKDEADDDEEEMEIDDD
ncbi:hypothetical protein MIR68_010150 [Amoeboaphelidium protococcarum]|nr:hypothetical protein MIR68_010150 [Amoeboaphelidium protococcarum]